MALELIFNGQKRVFNDLDEGSTISGLITALAVQPDRVAIERNGSIASRKTWAETLLSSGDRIEMVHFVGGGSGPIRFRVEAKDDSL